MSNILKVTTPLTGYENTNNIKNNPLTNPEATNIQAPVVPEKVVRPDGRNDAGRDAQMKQLNYESNFSNFIRLMRENPDAVENLARLLQERMGSYARQGISSEESGLLEYFFSRIGIKEADMSSYMQEQVDVSMRFKGPFFDLIRQAFRETSSVELKSGILDFLKKYVDMASGDHIMRTMMSALKQCQQHMFSGPAAELGKMMEELEQQMAEQKEALLQELPDGEKAVLQQEAAEEAREEAASARETLPSEKAQEEVQGGAVKQEETARQEGAAGQKKLPQQEQSLRQAMEGSVMKGRTEESAAFLKDRILPYLNKYISATHNRGGLRNLTVQMAYQLSRYENGSMEGLKSAFAKLLGHQDFQRFFEGLSDPKLLEDFLRKAADDSRKEEMTRGFIQMLKSGVKGEAGVETRQVLQNFVNNALLGESVYMPVLHMVLPMVVDGRLLYSEMWVDPDAQNAQDTAGAEGKAVKMLVKFDIEEVGFFDLFFLYKDGKMNLQLDYPDTYRDKDEEIRQNISRILSENDIRVETFVTGSSKESIPLTEAFPKIVERRNAVNVRV